MSKGPLLAVDLGEQGAGLAFSPDGRLVFSFGRLSFTTKTELTKKLIKKAKAKRATKVIFGLPLNQKGQSTKQSQWVKEMAQHFSQESKIGISFQDEYLTSWQAQENLKTKDRERGLDQEAARLILEEYLKNG